jgi:putative effector of murein hydrolase LrgA (UPF0299 family)
MVGFVLLLFLFLVCLAFISFCSRMFKIFVQGQVYGFVLLLFLFFCLHLSVSKYLSGGKLTILLGSRMVFFFFCWCV